MEIVDEKQRLANQNAQSQEMQPHAPIQAVADGEDGAAALITDGFLVPDLDSLDDAEPPAYGEQHDHVRFSQPGFDAGAEITDDGRININLHTKNRRLADLLAPTIDSQISVEPQAEPALPPAYIPSGLGAELGQPPPPSLNVVIQIVGSRGDVQPFVALGKVLKESYGHRVRIATHATFKSFVEENDLEFFNIGGDPAELMAFMVKHPGLMPGIDALRSGEVSKRRRGIQEMLLGCWRSCIEAGNGLGPPPKPHKTNEPLDLAAGLPGDEHGQPFVADAIIANPPSFAHIHVAEKLGIPVHMMFTMPWSPTRAFPHPLANIQSSNADDVMTNYMTYTLVEMLTWQGLGDVINRFRQSALDLPSLSCIWAPGLLNRLKVPYTYCWSPSLIPKPNDWGKQIDISGFYFLNLASSYTPEPGLAAFLEAGPPPVYIGFGSIVVDDPNAMTRMIFDAIHLAGVRALVSKGWGGLGADDVGLPEGVFMLGNVPHDWLFEHVTAVVHHGGAGTTAAGIKAGKPTIVVPFFGDQPFWGAMIARAKAGPEPTRYKDLTAEKLAESIKFCLEANTQERAKELGHKIREEAGTDVGAKSFHEHLDVDSLRCAVAPSRTAAWRVRRTKVRLSPLAASALIDAGLLEYRPVEYNTEDQPPDPVSAGAASLIGDLSGIGMAIADFPRGLFKSRRPKDGQDSESPTLQDSSSKLTVATTNAISPNESNTDLSSIHSRGGEGQEASRVLTAGSNQSLPELSPAPQSLVEARHVARPGGDTDSASSRTPSRARSRTRASSDHLRQTVSRRDSSPLGMSLDATVGAGRSVGRAVSTGVKSPMNFCLGLAKGFRNIPRLYNDDTVRPIEKVTDLNSGIKIAGKELGLGFFDGIAGLITQPIRGAEKDGAGGFVKGIGKGIGGLIVKPAAGIWGVPAYMMQGVHAEVNKMFTRSVQNYIITSRVVQGKQDVTEASEEEKSDIIIRWNSLKWDLKNFYILKRKEKAAEKTPTGSDQLTRSESPFSRPKTSWLHSRGMTVEERRKMQAQKRGFVDAPVPSPSGSSSAQQSLSDDAEFEQAIRTSVRETSRGNTEEDAIIEAAIRESVKAMRARRALLLETLPEASEDIPEKDPSIFEDQEYRITDEEYQTLVEQAIQQSLASHMEDVWDPHSAGVPEMEASSAEMHNAQASALAHADDDADLQRAIEESKNVSTPPSFDDEDELERAIEASKQEMDREHNQRTEEDIVLEYVKKQSLAEAEFHRKLDKGKGKAAPDESDDEDEELKRALEESLKLHKGDRAGPSGSGSGSRSRSRTASKVYDGATVETEWI
ncbi:UDP-glucuronosyl/UDP-glucosyltransferase [Metarhizium rileyi]|uniref:UDP-glucuronosyl/UDP-glucosyltransferase n=1 Tax=Metarhizium rileyi (strain RCEF 4871) TaxID=1649241 RepID=A0A167B4G6_METRR|nr:UDP-glucuronosyl/UDP-glucosyltransferase [Metarhizium rileyi RCEF 4871]